MSGGTHKPGSGGVQNKTSAAKPVKPTQVASGGTQKPKSKRA